MISQTGIYHTPTASALV